MNIYSEESTLLILIVCQPHIQMNNFTYGSGRWTWGGVQKTINLKYSCPKLLNT